MKEVAKYKTHFFKKSEQIMKEIRGLNISRKKSKFLGIKHCVCVCVPEKIKRRKQQNNKKKPRT